MRGISPGLRGNKIEYLKNLSDINNSEIIAVTETHLNDNVDDCEIHIPGWTVFRCDRHMRSGGGVLTYVKESLTVSNEFKGSDSVTEFLCPYINDLNMSHPSPEKIQHF